MLSRLAAEPDDPAGIGIGVAYVAAAGRHGDGVAALSC